MSLSQHVIQFLSNLNSSPELAYVLTRTCVIYIYAIFLIRFSARYQLQTPIDFVLIFTLGAILGGAIYGASLITMFCSSFVLVFVHKLFAFASFHSHFWRNLLKGKYYILYVNGKFHKKTMAKLQIAEDDIMEECRNQLQTTSLSSIKEIRMERTGQLCFIRKE